MMVCEYFQFWVPRAEGRQRERTAIPPPLRTPFVVIIRAAVVRTSAGKAPPPRPPQGRIQDGMAVFPGRACGVSVWTCGSAEAPGGDADESLEAAGEVALVPEPRPDGDLGQRQVVVAEQLLGPLDTASEDVLVRGQA